MVVIAPAPAHWDSAAVTLYQTTDPALGNFPVYVFYGPSTTTNTTLSSSRIQVHIFSLAGYQSYPRLTISPTSALYAAVEQLSEEKQGDETSRGLAIGLFKYFSELSSATRQCLTDMASLSSLAVESRTLFGAAHAAKLVTSMIRMESTATIASNIMAAMVEKHLTWVDMDVVISEENATRLKAMSNPEQEDGKLLGANRTTPLLDFLESLGSPAFLPTSKLRRAPSRPTTTSKPKSLSSAEVERLQRELMEATETEVTYVNKLRELVKLLPLSASSSPRDQGISALIGTLREIVQLNESFLRAIVELMEEVTSHVNYGQPNSATPGRHDITGAEAFSKILLTFVPKFKEPYQEYLKLSPQISRILAASRECEDSAFALAISQVGESRLKSWLIEPVQRLPRYSLFIDNMVGLLPSTHPAMNKFLKAKDFISDICALDSDDGDGNTTVVQRLSSVVAKWPSSLHPYGRLITATDAIELRPPYKHAPSDNDGSASLLIVFAETIVVLRKLENTTLSSRGLLAELQRPNHAPSTLDAENSTNQHHFAFVASLPIQEASVVEWNEGRNILLTRVQKVDEVNTVPKSTNCSVITKAYSLQGVYEDKASKFSEDVSRARVEHRFPESVRDGSAWSFRVLAPEADQLGLAVALFSPAEMRTNAQAVRGRGRVIVTLQDDSQTTRELEQSCVYSPHDINFKITLLGSDLFRLEGRTTDGRVFIDKASTVDFIPVLLKRVTEMLRRESQPVTIEAAQAQIASSEKILEGLRPRQRLNSTSSRSRLRPISPVKALSTIFGSSVKLSQYFTGGDALSSPSPTRGVFEPPKSAGAKNEVSDEASKSKFSVVSTVDAPASGSLLQLETTFNTYVVALHCRAGNIVGRILRNRNSADELAINELYNTLIEDPSQHQAAAEVPVDILFSAFEKYVAHEWKDRVGELLPHKLLQSLQTAFDKSPPAELARKIKALLCELVPPNRRALAASVKLLYDLLEASGNDADRGALTVSFAEVLIRGGEAHRYISLLDRLVDDVDTFFDDIGDVEVPAPGQNSNQTSLRRMRSINTGSLSSTGSSLRRRFGFGLLSRENSKTDAEPKKNGVWRSLSKKSSADTVSTASGSLSSRFKRAKSTERDPHLRTWSRPGSVERPCSSSSIQESPHSAIGSFQSSAAVNQALETPTKPSRRPKRRSSLSDLQDLDRQASPFDRNSPLPRRTPPNAKAQGNKLTKAPPTHFPPRSSSRPASPSKKENIAPDSSLPRPETSKIIEPTATAKPSVHHERQNSKTTASRLPLAERPWGSDNQQVSAHGSSTSRQLKSQSPQKIRDRLDKESQATKTTGDQLHATLLDLQNDLHKPHAAKRSSLEARGLQTRLEALERQLGDSQHETQSRLQSIQKDVDSSLIIAEQKYKKLDKVYQAAHVENELLYDRFNAELAKVFQNLKADGLSAVLEKLQEAQGEVAKLKKENFRLKRENIQLRSHLAE